MCSYTNSIFWRKLRVLSLWLILLILEKQAREEPNTFQCRIFWFMYLLAISFKWLAFVMIRISHIGQLSRCLVVGIKSLCSEWALHCTEKLIWWGQQLHIYKHARSYHWVCSCALPSLLKSYVSPTQNLTQQQHTSCIINGCFLKAFLQGFISYGVKYLFSRG